MKKFAFVLALVGLLVASESQGAGKSAGAAGRAVGGARAAAGNRGAGKAFNAGGGIQRNRAIANRGGAGRGFRGGFGNNFRNGQFRSFGGRNQVFLNGAWVDVSAAVLQSFGLGFFAQPVSAFVQTTEFVPVTTFSVTSTNAVLTGGCAARVGAVRGFRGW